MKRYFERVQQSAEFLKKWDGTPPDLCVVLGSGLADAIPGLTGMKCLRFDEIPGFNHVSVHGHVGELRVGTVSGGGQFPDRKVGFLRGRTHAYEGFTAGDVAHNVRAMVAWGTKGIVLTNASGCLNTHWEVGRIMMITDHINQTSMSPQFGEFGNGFGPRFGDMSQIYNLDWQQSFRKCAQELNQTLYEGIYYGVAGPDYETPAEIRMMKGRGADAVGMSTVIEAIASHHLGARVAGLACLTNYGSGLKGAVLEHNHVIQMGKQNSQNMATLLLKAIPTLSFPTP